MTVRIKETNELKELVAIDQDSGCEWTADLIEAGNFEAYDDYGNPVMEQDDFDWWVDIINQLEENQREKKELVWELDQSGEEPPEHDCWLDYVGWRFVEVQGGDLEDNVSAVTRELAAIRDEYL